MVEVSCWRCGAPTAQAAGWTGLQLCPGCRRVQHRLPADSPVTPWRPTIARVLPGEFGAPIDRQRSSAAPAPTHRVIVPMRDALGAELDCARPLIDMLTAAGRFWTYATYAMAEEIATATLVESIAVRFTLPDGRRGVALWWDWRWHGALLAGGPGLITREHLEALITGAPWPPPAVVCPRCGTAVRQNADGSPRAHGKKRRCRGFWVDLRNGLPIHPDERIAK